MRRRDMLALGLTAALPRAAAAQTPQAGPQPLARFPAGTFLENLVVRPDGTVLFTSYFGRSVEAWSAATGPGRLAAVPIHAVSLTGLPDGGLALAGHGAPFTAGPAALAGSNAVLLLDAVGRVLRTLPLPEAGFLNGGLLLAPGRLLLADSALGRIWELTLETGAARVWLQDPALSPDPARPGLPGVNGLQRTADGRALLVSNSATRRLLRLPLDADGAPAGLPALVAEFPGIDDFCVLPDGTIWAATHAEGVARLRSGAARPDVLPAPGLEGSTAVAPVPGGGALYVLGTGGLAAGGHGEAMLARLTIPA